MEQICKNCNNSFTGTYCNNCGQKFDVPQFTFKHILEEAFHAFTHADKSFITYAKKLIINPGKLAYEYIVERKRKQYYNPFTFFILITTISAFTEGVELNLKEKLFHENNEYGHLFNVYSKVLSLIIIPLVALVIWLIHLNKRKLRYSEYTVFTMMLLSLLSILDIAVSVINFSFTGLLHTYVGIEDHILFAISVVIYIAYANYQFHKNLHNSSIFKSLLTGVFFIIVQLAIYLFVIYAIKDFTGIGKVVFYGIEMRF